MKPRGQTTDQRDNDANDKADPIQAAAAYGIDVAQLRDNLALTVAERLRRHQIALDTLEILRQAKRP
ncbi:MAG: hypothetical protein JW993_06005 [Sedimentisphaerales bacterium]|nr:hypothetical protein [Sedimentisphaerales bacterium]